MSDYDRVDADGKADAIVADLRGKVEIYEAAIAAALAAEDCCAETGAIYELARVREVAP